MGGSQLELSQLPIQKQTKMGSQTGRDGGTVARDEPGLTQAFTETLSTRTKSCVLLSS
jgi:hypothetical protein